MNVQTTIDELKSLSVPERLQVLEAVWDSIEADSAPVSLPPEHKSELDRRLDAHDANPDDLLTWDQVLERLRGRL